MAYLVSKHIAKPKAKKKDGLGEVKIKGGLEFFFSGGYERPFPARGESAGGKLPFPHLPAIQKRSC